MLILLLNKAKLFFGDLGEDNPDKFKFLLEPFNRLD